MDPVSTSPRFSCKLSDIEQHFCFASFGSQRSRTETGALHLLLPCVAASSKPLLRQLFLLQNSCTGSLSLTRSLALSLPLSLSPSLPLSLPASLHPSLAIHPPVFSAVSSHMSTLVLGRSPELLMDDGRGAVVRGSCGRICFC